MKPHGIKEMGQNGTICLLRFAFMLCSFFFFRIDALFLVIIKKLSALQFWFATSKHVQKALRKSMVCLSKQK